MNADRNVYWQKSVERQVIGYAREYLRDPAAWRKNKKTARREEEHDRQSALDAMKQEAPNWGVVYNPNLGSAKYLQKLAETESKRRAAQWERRLWEYFNDPLAKGEPVRLAVPERITVTDLHTQLRKGHRADYVVDPNLMNVPTPSGAKSRVFIPPDAGPFLPWETIPNQFRSTKDSPLGILQGGALRSIWGRPNALDFTGGILFATRNPEIIRWLAYAQHLLEQSLPKAWHSLPHMTPTRPVHRELDPAESRLGPDHPDFGRYLPPFGSPFQKKTNFLPQEGAISLNPMSMTEYSLGLNLTGRMDQAPNLARRL